jgi:hypothetical protein
MSGEPGDRIIALVQRLEREANEILEARLEKAKLEVNDMITQALRQIVSSAMGMRFETFGARWDVDHTNGHAMPIATELGQYAMDLARSTINTALAEMFPEGKVPKEWQQTFYAEVKRQYDYKIREMAGQVVEKLVKDHALALVEGVKVALDKKRDAEKRLAGPKPGDSE